ncbi:hypothetical protein K1T71_015170 [Dendrolimus kikuchii]|nr:hypothetical protein K1T71_015170 [Dendrolimus kikuchii]
MKSALIRSKNQLDNYKERKPSNNLAAEDFCDVCNVVYHYLESTEHEATEKHKKLVVYERLLPRMYQLFKDTDKNLHLIDEIDEIFKKYVAKTVKIEVGKTYCEICDVYKCSAGFNGHLKGKKHKNNCAIKNIPMTKVKKVNKEEKYCEVCNVFKSAHNFVSHLDSKKHKKKARKLAKDNESNDEIDDDLDAYDIQRLTKDHAKYLVNIHGSELKRCTICMAEFVDEEEVIKEHFEQEKHLVAYKDILLNKNIIKLANEQFCVQCDELIPDLIEHVRMPKHNKIYLLNNDETYCDLCNVKVPRSGNYLHQVGAKHRANEKKRRTEKIKYIDIEISDDIDKKSLTVVNNKLSCSICNETFDDEDALVDHFKGINHKFELLKYSQDNGLEPENEIYHCKKCEVSVEKNDILEHLRSSDHKLNTLVKPSYMN